ncbi:hypothetical protein [Nocardia flavorosea]|uniref:hypothetical protein n=1 Tax=Nocardia flavorosea TaxID=53429 RepID=UPI002458B427|nr:hypothetical protein [Nocardia flavorosea]
MSRNSNQLSVAELLARNGQQPTSGGGGRRRRGGRGVSVSELTGDLPVVDGGTTHAAADEDEDPAGSPTGYSPAGNGYAPHDYAGEQVSGGEPSQSPMSGPITVYNPLAPHPDDAPPARLGEPSPYPAGDAAPPRGGRRRRPEPDDDEPSAAAYPGADPNPPWETGPPLPSGGRAARRRAAEAAEAASVVEDSPVPAAETPAGYDLPPAAGGFGAFPAPAPAAPPEFGHPDMGPPSPAPENGGPPRLGPPALATEAWPAPAPATEAWPAPAPATEAWPAPAPAGDARPKLERRRRGARPLPDPAPWPEPPPGPPGEPANADQATAVWSLAEPNQGAPAGPPVLGAPPLEKTDRGRRRGKRNGHPDTPPAPGFAESGPPHPDLAAGDGFRNTDMYATDVHGPMPPAPGPMPREHGTDTGDFEPDSDFYAVPEDEIDDEPKGRNRFSRSGKPGAVSTKFGGASGKLAAARSRLATGGRERDSADAADPRKQWAVLGAQSLGAALAGMLMFKGFEMLWEMQPLMALALAVVVILGLVALVRILRRTDDIFSTVIAVVAGVFVTLGPLAFLLSTG